MVFNILLYVSLIIFSIGLIYKISTWFLCNVTVAAKDVTVSARILAAVKGIFSALFSSKIAIIVRVFFFDVLLQHRILKLGFLRWLTHSLIFGGFMMLLLMHALDSLIIEPIFAEYQSTKNPFMFLRDLFALMVCVGIAIAVYRRFFLKISQVKNSAQDKYAITVLAVIMLSGIWLEGVKISSYSEFQNMVEEYSFIDDKTEKTALESLWVKEFGVVSPNTDLPSDAEALALGQESHENYCADCHSSTGWAFTGMAAAKIISPVALLLDRINAVTILYYIHIMACFIGLAYLPFSKMFHIIATPLSLLAGAVMDRETSCAANIATRQVIELDACTHCGACSMHCSAIMISKALANEYVLPSEKMAILKTLTTGKEIGQAEIKAVRQGVYMCTNCDRCTVVCPSGINLKELWPGVRENLLQGEVKEPLLLSPFSFVRGLNRADFAADDYSGPLKAARQALAGNFNSLMNVDSLMDLGDTDTLDLSLCPGDATFAHCFECRNCTTVCPVVADYDNPEEELGLLPHQIMCCLGLGMIEMASGAGMIWDCLTCYQCQEHCPQNVSVTDLMYRLKHLAVSKRLGLAQNSTTTV